MCAARTPSAGTAGGQEGAGAPHLQDSWAGRGKSKWCAYLLVQEPDATAEVAVAAFQKLCIKLAQLTVKAGHC